MHWCKMTGDLNLLVDVTGVLNRPSPPLHLKMAAYPLSETLYCVEILQGGHFTSQMILAAHLVNSEINLLKPSGNFAYHQV
jgi:hypothetical protein